MSDTGILDQLDQATREALERHILTLADTKRVMGIRYSDWLLGAPSIETGIAASSMAQDEWGHARLLYAMLKDFGRDPVGVEHDRSAEEYASADPLDEPFGDWAEVVAGVVIVDGAMEAALRAFSEGTFELASTRVPKMLAEEEFHADFGAAWFRRLAAAGGEASERLKAAAEAMLGPVLAWLAPSDEAHAALASANLTLPAADIRSSFEESVGPLLQAVGIDISTFPAATEGWDGNRRRGPGCPGMEAVERARGDLNRALFVE